MSIIHTISNLIRSSDSEKDESDNRDNSHNIGDNTLTHILIDYENLLPQNLEKVKVNRHLCHVWLFVGKKQNKINTGLIQDMSEFGNRAHYIYIDVARPNALDFHLSYYLGYIAATYPGSKVMILSKDQGYESIMQHARDKHHFTLLTRHDDTTIIEKRHHKYPPHVAHQKNRATVEKTQEKSDPLFGKCIRNAIIQLTREDTFLPRKRERLENLLAKYVVQPIYEESNTSIDEATCQKEAAKVLKQLMVARFISENEETGLITYHTDEESLYQRLQYFVNRKRPAHVVPLKELVAYNYAFRDLDKDSDGVFALINQLKKDGVLSIVKGGHVTYPDNTAQRNPANNSMDHMVERVTQLIQRGHALPSAKQSLYNVIGTHLGIKGEEKIIQKIVAHLETQNLICIHDEKVSYPTQQQGSSPQSS